MEYLVTRAICETAYEDPGTLPNVFVLSLTKKNVDKLEMLLNVVKNIELPGICNITLDHSHGAWIYDEALAKILSENNCAGNEAIVIDIEEREFECKLGYSSIEVSKYGSFVFSAISTDDAYFTPEIGWDWLLREISKPKGEHICLS